MSYWRTTAISPLPPGWVAVLEMLDGTLDPVPCPALLLQEEVDGDQGYPPDTRVLPALHIGEGEFHSSIAAPTQATSACEMAVLAIVV